MITRTDLSLAFSKAAMPVETELKSVAAVSRSSRNCRFILRPEDEVEVEDEWRNALDMCTAFMRNRRLPEECVRKPYLRGREQICALIIRYCDT